MGVRTKVKVRFSEIDLLNPPDNLEEIVAEQFGQFTHGTAEDFTDSDRLSFIENIRNSMYSDEQDGVMEIIHDYIDYEINDIGGDIPTKDDYDTFEMMQWCYEKGERRFDFARETDSIDYKDKLKAEHTLCRIIKTVMNWEYRRG